MVLQLARVLMCLQTPTNTPAAAIDQWELAGVWNYATPPPTTGVIKKDDGITGVNLKDRTGKRGLELDLKTSYASYSLGSVNKNSDHSSIKSYHILSPYCKPDILQDALLRAVKYHYFIGES